MGAVLRERAAAVARATAGVLLVSWRYLWAVTPLHRSARRGDASDLPPPLPEELIDERSQPWREGTGPLFHRLFSVDVEGATMSAEGLVALLAADLGGSVPAEVTTVEAVRTAGGELRPGDEVVVRLPGPWDGPVRVVRRTPTSLHLATLAGHLEAGQIEFRARPPRDGRPLRFEVEVWARPANRIVDLLYTRLRMAKEVQLNMWVRFCLTTARRAGGRARCGVTISTRVLDQPTPVQGPHRPCP
ncbi:uncharacterized protein DUF1990 [Prauserella shujinwangii]|uniref:Uncharacterized protein DUF1990 n=1 Tax=Prauserella shujinwangii TaxID=1453103 RepID=A0A2T0LRL5_9PSEU|nr:DUF1990 family protein [Prauserella shujinwangii]PRX46141.1 uncharacterized protein DUF1990 [Prauserella shujinwangii]